MPDALPFSFDDLAHRLLAEVYARDERREATALTLYPGPDGGIGVSKRNAPGWEVPFAELAADHPALRFLEVYETAFRLSTTHALRLSLAALGPDLGVHAPKPTRPPTCAELARIDVLMAETYVSLPFEEVETWGAWNLAHAQPRTRMFHRDPGRSDARRLMFEPAETTETAALRRAMLPSIGGLAQVVLSLDMRVRRTPEAHRRPSAHERADFAKRVREERAGLPALPFALPSLRERPDHG